MSPFCILWLSACTSIAAARVSVTSSPVLPCYKNKKQEEKEGERGEDKKRLYTWNASEGMSSGQVEVDTHVGGCIQLGIEIPFLLLISCFCFCYVLFVTFTYLTR